MRSTVYSSTLAESCREAPGMSLETQILSSLRACGLTRTESGSHIRRMLICSAQLAPCISLLQDDFYFSPPENYVKPSLQVLAQFVFKHLQHLQRQDLPSVDGGDVRTEEMYAEDLADEGARPLPGKCPSTSGKSLGLLQPGCCWLWTSVPVPRFAAPLRSVVIAVCHSRFCAAVGAGSLRAVPAPPPACAA